MGQSIRCPDRQDAKGYRSIRQNLRNIVDRPIAATREYRVESRLNGAPGHFAGVDWGVGRHHLSFYAAVLQDAHCGFEYALALFTAARTRIVEKRRPLHNGNEAGF